MAGNFLLPIKKLTEQLSLKNPLFAHIGIIDMNTTSHKTDTEIRKDNLSRFQDYRPAGNLLESRIILVTGAGDGIGRCAAITFAQYGATVILLGRTLSKLEQVYDEIEHKGYAKPAIFPMNLESASEHDYQTMFDSLNNEFGRLDGLLHNAAELGPQTPIANYPLEAWQKVLQVNITAPFMITKTLLPLMQNSDNASVIFTGSSVGLMGRAYWGAYSVSKAACENLVEILCDECDGTKNIRVNSINPGATQTRMRASAYPAENPTTVTEPTAIMNGYLFLMSRDSDNISGQQFDSQPQ
ncbi:MAG: NAD(P)-dependent dehydrogenase (short-subunit alcohol dehydrogenase family) [Lentisphaeria bacterium]